MTGAGSVLGLPAGFARYPGVVLQLSADGIVVGSNGRLEEILGVELEDRLLVDFLDPESTHDKWRRILAGAADADSDEPIVWELIFVGLRSLGEPRRFTILWDDTASRFWMFEHRVDPRLDRLQTEVTGINTELSNAQRELIKERSRLTTALAELEEQYRRSEELATTVGDQNHELEAQNDELLLLTEELRARGEDLERSNAALDEFAHVVSHDLKAPLRAISNYATWLDEDLPGSLPAESRAHLDRMLGSVTRMRTMIDGVLEYARVGRNRAPPVTIDVRSVIVEVVDLLGPAAEPVVRIDGEMPTLTTELSPLRQVFLNLISNAVRYANPDDPHVRVSARPEGSFWRFSVADNGPGIPERVQDRIWLLFQTLEPVDGSAGTGIGLAVVRKLVDAQGGRVWVESKVGDGATFHFLWPETSMARP